MAAVIADARPVVLAFNSGSSSLKFGLFEMGGAAPRELVAGSFETTDDHGALFDSVDAALGRADMPAPIAIGHRVVHGGAARNAHCLIDDAVIRDLVSACAYAPIHGPAALALIKAARARYPTLPQATCFDTVFHAGMPDVARILPIPGAFRAPGVRRYGFHGLSCESIVRQLGSDLPARLVIAHLGNGASVTAVRDGRSIDTSMGLTPAGGVVMATRSGDIDPGVLLYLLREKGLDGAALEQLIDHRSGMLGVSGLSGDMRVLHEAAADNPDADLAVRLFCQSVGKQIGAMIAVLEGVDMLVLTGGIGEHDILVGDALRQRLAWSGAEVRVLRSQEDEQIALHTASLAA
jgi:acetate kinase